MEEGLLYVFASKLIKKFSYTCNNKSKTVALFL